MPQECFYSLQLALLQITKDSPVAFEAAQPLPRSFGTACIVSGTSAATREPGKGNQGEHRQSEGRIQLIEAEDLFASYRSTDFGHFNKKC